MIFNFVAALRLPRRLAILFAIAAPAALHADSASSLWWQTECQQHGGAVRDTTVVFRNFGEPNVLTEGAERMLVVDDRGIQYRFAGHTGNFHWTSLNKVIVRQIGNKNPALSVTLVINGTEVGGEPFGVVEYSCWRAMEAFVEQYAPGRIEGSPPKPHWPLHDEHGNVIAK